MKQILCVTIAFYLRITCASSQDTISMPLIGNGGFYNSCYAVIYDNGVDSNYQNFSNSTITISPLWVQSVNLYFEEFQTEAYFDSLTIYDGPGTTFPKIGTYWGTSLQGQTINSTGNSITLEFRSDDIQTASGFKAWVGCVMSNEEQVVPKLSVYPNPTSGFFNIEGIDLSAIAYLKVFDLFGKEIHKLVSSSLVNIEHLAPGVYTLLVRYKDGNSYTQKLIKE